MTIINRDKGIIFLKTKKAASSSIELHLIAHSDIGSDIYSTSREILDLGLPRSRNSVCLLPGSSVGWSDSENRLIRQCQKVRGFSRAFPHLQQHDSAHRVRKFVGRSFFSRATRLAPVRNPWDALVSWYEWLRTAGYSRSPKPDWNFRDWLRHGLSHSQTSVAVESHQSRLFYSHLYIPHKGFLVEVEVLPIHFEGISQSLEAIATKVGIRVPAFDKQSIHLKPGKRRRDYREYYSDHDAELVHNHFSRYLSRFPYQFDRVGRLP